MNKIKLSDGRELEVLSFGIASSGYMFIRVEMSMVDAIQYFSTGTDVITYEAGGESRRYVGFTNLAYVVNEVTNVRVALVRPAEFWEAK